MRLAWFSPWPPQRSGIAGRSAELVPLLAARGHAIDVCVDEAAVPLGAVDSAPTAEGQYRVIGAHDFVWRHARGQYDLPVYQIGNSRLHQFIWPYVFKYPGLVVLHDARLHHARAEALLSQDRAGDYRDEFAWNHPAVAAASGLGLLGPEGVYYYFWPMLRAVVASSRLVASHSRLVVNDLRSEWPDRAVEYIALGEGPEHLDLDEARRRFRADHGISPSATVFGVPGTLTAEKHLPHILHAFAATRAWAPDARLLLVGAVDPYLGLHRLIEKLGLAGAVCQIADADDEEFDRSIAASDVTIHLRWPTALETSGPWLRSLAMARPTIILDLPQHGHVPSLDPRTWKRQTPCDDLGPDAESRAVTIALDLADLDHSLRAALRRLVGDSTLRERLGREARRYWEREHTVSRMADDYQRALALAVTCPTPSPDWPAHLRPDPVGHLRRILDHSGLGGDALADRLSHF